jgi:hypothetical protein
VTRLADLVLVLHGLFVLFVVAGLLAIWIGACAGWRWVRQRAFRVAHLGAIGFVAVTSVLGLACPLTVLEDWLRTGTTTGPGFIGRWVGRLIYYDLPSWVFTAGYLVFTLLVIASWVFVPPTQTRNHRS